MTYEGEKHRKLPTYNGWSNYITWYVFSYITDEQIRLNYYLDLIRPFSIGDAEEILSTTMFDDYIQRTNEPYKTIFTWGANFIDWQSIIRGLNEL